MIPNHGTAGGARRSRAERGNAGAPAGSARALRRTPRQQPPAPPGAPARPPPGAANGQRPRPLRPPRPARPLHRPFPAGDGASAAPPRARSQSPVSPASALGAGQGLAIHFRKCCEELRGCSRREEALALESQPNQHCPTQAPASTIKSSAATLGSQKVSKTK